MACAIRVGRTMRDDKEMTYWILRLHWGVWKETDEWWLCRFAVFDEQGGRALWCYSVQRSYASKREVRADHPDVPATWLSLTWWSCWNIGREVWISFSQAVCFTIMKNGTSSFMTSARDALVFVQVCVCVCVLSSSSCFSNGLSPARLWPRHWNRTPPWTSWICRKTTSALKGRRLGVWWRWCHEGRGCEERQRKGQGTAVWNGIWNGFW